VVVHETLANLSKLPPDLIELIERHCQEPSLPLESPGPPASGSAAASAIHLGPCYGVLAALDGLARELGLVQAVGEQSRSQRLARFLIYARLAHQGSRLSAARWSEDHAVREILQVGRFEEEIFTPRWRTWKPGRPVSKRRWPPKRPRPRREPFICMT